MKGQPRVTHSQPLVLLSWSCYYWQHSLTLNRVRVNFPWTIPLQFLTTHILHLSRGVPLLVLVQIGEDAILSVFSISFLWRVHLLIPTNSHFHLSSPLQDYSMRFQMTRLAKREQKERNQQWRREVQISCRHEHLRVGENGCWKFFFFVKQIAS